MQYNLRKTAILVFILIAGGIFNNPQTTRAETSAASLNPLDQYGGPAARVTVSGGYAYLGMGPRLVRFSLANPLQPAFSGQSDILPGNVTAIAIQGQYA